MVSEQNEIVLQEVGQGIMTISRSQMGSQLTGNKMKKTKKMLRGGPAMAGRPNLGRGTLGAAGPVPAGAGGKPAPRPPKTGMIGQALAGRPKTGMIGSMAAAGPVRGGAGPKPRPPLAGLGTAPRGAMGMGRKAGGKVTKKSTGGKLKGPKR